MPWSSLLHATRESGEKEEIDRWGKQNPFNSVSVLLLIEIKPWASWGFVCMTDYDPEQRFHFLVQNNIVGKVIIKERKKRHTAKQALIFSIFNSY